ncbi:hypothetical protein [Ktedonobacter robiniae]|uniref:Uncharacterized protein n=1 Tax=Ktedonobacter robiniae TaxID=2778365 RepID=A0ABQ3UZ10_9CHLR|nr:hypothetical protein [Ktedonobacter robiniae]GHO57894.1 hypothetical protein KSB_63690 [Ktedonobacter robiniae]
MEARAGEHKVALHDSESARQFQALLKKPTKAANGKAEPSQKGMSDSPSGDGQIFEAINPLNGNLYWSKAVSGLLSGDPQILAFGDILILPQCKQVVNRANGNVLWRFSGGDFIMKGAVGQ